MDCSRGQLQPTGVDVSPKKPKQRRRSRHVMDLDYDGKCSVCQGKAGPHIYYGARACLPCRAFFKRSVEQHQQYVCFGEQQCEVTLSGRKTCKYCRFQACLRGGMRMSYVLNERPRTPIINHELLTPQEARNIQHLAGVSRIFDKSKIGVLSSWKKFLQEIIRWILFHKELSEESKMFIELEIENKTRRFVMKLPFFQRLPEYEKENILQKNVSVGVLFQKCTFFNPSYNLDIQLEALLGQREVEKLKRKLKAYGISHEMAENTFKFNDLFAFPPDIDMERFVRIQSQISYWPRDCHEYILLLLIILFEPSHIAETGTVDRIQTYFSQLLFKYLLTISEGERRWKAVGRFGSGIDCISKCAELHDLFTKRMFPLTDDIKLLFDEMPFYY